MIYRLQLLSLSLFFSYQFCVQCISNDWTTHVWKDGRTYYFNHKTGITQWETPSDLSIETNPTSVRISVPAVIEPSDHRRRPMRSSLSHHHTTINGTTTANKTLGTNRTIEHNNSSTIHETEKYDNFVNGKTNRTINSQKNILQKTDEKSILYNSTIHEQTGNDSMSERYSQTIQSDKLLSNVQSINEQKIAEMENMETNSSKSSRKVDLDMQSKFNILLKKYRVVTNHLTKSEKSRHKLMKKLKEISRNHHPSRSSGTDVSSSVSHSKSIKENKNMEHDVSEHDEPMEGSATNESIIQEKIETHYSYDNSSTTVREFSDTTEVQSQQSKEETIIESNDDLKNRNTEVYEENISTISQTSTSTDTRKNSERESDSIRNIQLQNRLQMQENELIEAYAEIETMKLDLKNIATSSLKKLKQKSFLGRVFDLFRNQGSRYATNQAFKNKKRGRLSSSLINESEDNNIDIVTAYKNELKAKGKRLAIDTTLASYSDIEKKYHGLVKNHTKALEELQLKNDLIESLKQQYDKKVLINDKNSKLIEMNDNDENNEINKKRSKEDETSDEEAAEEEEKEEEGSEDNDDENDIKTDKPVDILNDNDETEISETDVIRVMSSNNELTNFILVDNVVTVTESDVQELMRIIENSESAIGKIQNQANDLLDRIRFLEEMPQLLHRLYNYLEFIRRDYNTYELSSRHTVWVAFIQQILRCYNLTLKDCETKETLLMDENSDLKNRICDTELLMTSALSNQDKLNSELSECRKKIVTLEERMKFNSNTTSMMSSNSGLLESQVVIPAPPTSSPSSQSVSSSMSQISQSTEPHVIPLLLPHHSSARHIHQSVGSHVKHALVKIMRSILKILSFGKL